MYPKGTQLKTLVSYNTSADGSSPRGAIKLAVEGAGSPYGGRISLENRPLSMWSALDKPLKACKLHDAFTSVLPSPQKGPEVAFAVGGELPVDFKLLNGAYEIEKPDLVSGLIFKTQNEAEGVKYAQFNYPIQSDEAIFGDFGNASVGVSEVNPVLGWNVGGTVDLANAINVSVNDLRTSVATQQVLELLARGGSRYWSFLKSFFGVEVENPFPDIPTQIGHIRRELDLYQVAQTSASEQGGSPQGSLTAFGYTTKGGALFTKTFLEHGYVHVLAVVRHKNIYTSYLAPDNFRRNTMDWYLPQLANIGEQPIRLATLNPFHEEAMDRAIGYQEAWWDYRMEMDQVHGVLRTGLDESLDIWHYGDNFHSDFTHVNDGWLKSNTQEILDRTLAITSELAPQFIGMFEWNVTKQRPLPVYSVPGLDTI